MSQSDKDESTSLRRSTRSKTRSQVLIREDLSSATDELFEALGITFDDYDIEELNGFGQVLIKIYETFSRNIKELISSLQREKSTDEACSYIKELSENRTLFRTKLQGVNDKLSSFGQEPLSYVTLCNSSGGKSEN